MCNPYESPRSVAGPPEHALRLPFDIGRFVGCYLQGLACVSVASIAVHLVFFDQLHIDLSFVFLFWAGACLMRHSPTARKWVIGISCLFISVCVAMILCAVYFGTSSMTVLMGRLIDNPSVGQVTGAWSFTMLLAGIPLLLLTRQARNEFSQST